MKNQPAIKGDRIFLRRLLPSDVTLDYFNWLRDKEITQFLESRWQTHTLAGIKEYVRLMSKGRHDFLFGIFLNDSKRHIGNIKIGDIDKRHNFGHIGLIIGDKGVWGKNYGTEAIKLATNYAINKLRLNKLVAGIYANNVGSYKAFLKAGYKEAGRLKDHRVYKDGYVDEIVVERCRDREGVL